MAKYASNTLLLAVETTPASGTYTTVLFTSEHTLTVGAESVDVTDKTSGGWTEILSGAGVRNVAVSMSGFVSDDAGYAIVKAAILSNTILKYRITYANGSTITGDFHIPSEEIAAPANQAQTFSHTFNSSGIPVFA